MDQDRPDIICTELIKAALKKYSGDLVGFRSHPGTLKGDNYMGDLFTVEVDLRVQGGEVKTLHWMLKALKPNPVSGGKHLGRMMQVFAREAAVYTDLMPNLNKMSEIKYCHVVHVDETQEKEALILENMKHYGWGDALNKKGGLTLPYVNLAIKWLAKFHALSYVHTRTGVDGVEDWQEKNPWSYTFTQKQPAEFAEFHENMIAFVMEQQEKFKMIANFLSRDPSATHNYNAFVEKMFKTGTLVMEMRAKAQQPRGKFVTLTHLDPWFNNMLFQHDDKSQPTDVLLLDFQLVGIAHPGNDLVYFLVTSTTPEVRKDHLEDILSLYHKTLHEELEKVGHLGIDYTLEDIKEDYKFGLNLTPSLIVMAMPLMLAADGEDTMDIGGLDFTDTNKVKEMGKDSNHKFEQVLANNVELRNRIKGALDEFIDAEII